MYGLNKSPCKYYEWNFFLETCTYGDMRRYRPIARSL